jgi:N utilization substance protein A
VYRDDVAQEEDVALTDFTDEIEEWVIEALQSVGCDTARDVLNMSVEDLVNRTDLEEETIQEVRAILQAEFED